MTTHDPITEPCPACKQRAVLALWLADGEFVHVDPDQNGNLAGSLDGNGFAWVRPVVPGELLAVDEELYRPHEPSCAAPVAPVRRIGSARSLRRPVSRAAERARRRA